MISVMVFACLLASISAPFAALRLMRIKADHVDWLAAGSLWSALGGLSAILSGLYVRSESTAALFELFEVAGALGAAGLLFAAHRSEPFKVDVRSALAPVGPFALVMILTGSDLVISAVAAWIAVTAWVLISRILFRLRLAGLWREAGPVEILSLSYLVVHAAQLAQFVAAGRLSLAVPLAATLALAIPWLAFAVHRRRVVVPRYERSGLSKRASAELFHHIEIAMQESKPFKALDFRREDLAALVSADARAVGEAINRNAGVGFPEYLRRYRIREAERLLACEENIAVSLEALGMEAGFRSRSSFYSAFEAALGMTPGERRRQISNSR